MSGVYCTVRRRCMEDISGTEFVYRRNERICFSAIWRSYREHGFANGDGSVSYLSTSVSIRRGTVILRIMELTRDMVVVYEGKDFLRDAVIRNVKVFYVF